MYFTTGKKIEAVKRCRTNTVGKCLPEGPNRSG